MPSYLFRSLAVAAVAVLTGLRPLPAHAYPEQVITVIIPYAAGGGFDVTARAIAPFIEKHLPKPVNVVPRNLPGAGGMEGAAAVYRAKPDGYTIGIFNMPGFVLPALMGQNVGFDLKKMTWLGRVEATYYVLVVNAKSPYHSLADLKAAGRKIKFTATGYGSTALAAAQIAAKVLGIDASYIAGYRGGPEYLIGLVRGDGDAAMGIREISQRYIRTGDLRALLSFESGPTGFPGVPRAAGVGAAELQGLGLDRIIGAPPGLDPAIRRTLADALWAAMHDPGFVAQAEKAQIDLDPLNADDTTKLVERSLGFYDRYKDVLAPPH